MGVGIATITALAPPFIFDFITGVIDGMGYTSTLSANFRLSITETADDSISPASQDGGNSRIYDTYGLDVRLTADTTPATHGAIPDLSHAIPGGGTTTFDLTACPAARDTNVEEIDLTGKKLLAWSIKAPIGNADPVTVEPGASNAYHLFGSSTAKIVLYPGQVVCSGFVEASGLALPAVSGTAKTVKVSGTEADEINIIMVFGDPA